MNFNKKNTNFYNSLRHIISLNINNNYNDNWDTNSRGVEPKIENVTFESNEFKISLTYFLCLFRNFKSFFSLTKKQIIEHIQNINKVFDIFKFTFRAIKSVLINLMKYILSVLLGFKQGTKHFLKAIKANIIILINVLTNKLEIIYYLLIPNGKINWILNRLKILVNFKDLEIFYDTLDNDISKELLLELIAYRLLGYKKVKLKRFFLKYYEYQDIIQNLPEEGNRYLLDWKLNDGTDVHLRRISLKSVGFDINLYCTIGGGAITYLQEQYSYFSAKFNCEADDGDVVIDAGACWGDTPLYFASKVGKKGKVYAFEFIPSNLKVLKENLRINQHKHKNVEIIDRPLWSKSNVNLYYVDWGPGSRVSLKKLRADFEENKVKTLSIDDFVEKHKIKKVDFIKMDIEGAEIHALNGAINTLKRYKPKLALSIYHNFSDFSEIPKLLRNLNIDYKYVIDHHTIYENETVLFCK